jgi:hypothetical protein
MRHDVMSPPVDTSEASGRTGLSQLFGGRRRGPTLLALVLVVGLGVLLVLRATAPADGSAERVAATAAPRPSAPVRFTPSPSASPRGDLPRADVVDASRDRLIGNTTPTGAKPGEQGVFAGVTQILNWYCPDSTALESSIDQLQGWRSVRVVTHPHAGIRLELFLHWTGGTYRWQGPLETLQKCW